MDPCQRDREPLAIGSGSGGGGRPKPGEEPRSLRSFLGKTPGLDSHIVVRGTYLPDTERCTTGIPYRPPSYLAHEDYDFIENALSIDCYVDLRVSEFILGSGPSTLTVVRHFYTYGLGAAQAVFLEQSTGMSERAWFEDLSQRFEGEEYVGGIAGREEILFIGPHSNLSVDVWETFTIWDVQRKEDNTVIAVHPQRDLWRRLRPDDYQTHLPKLEMELPAFKQAVAAAHQARVTEYGGRIGPSDAEGIVEGAELPMLISSVDQLQDYYIAVGSYDHPDGPPAQPTPVPTCANGTVIPNPGSNRGLVYDCEALLSVKDTLRGTAALNWSVDTAIASWDGVSLSGTPNRVRGLDLSGEGLNGSIPGAIGDLYELTVLDLSNNSLTGDIPEELGWLYNLEEVRLSANTLTGCLPVDLEEAGTNDLSSLNLVYCQPPHPKNVVLGMPDEYSVEVSWDAVSNTSKYRVEYYNEWLRDWVVDADAITGTSHTVDGLRCDRTHWFRVRSYGTGTVYTATWSEPSPFLRGELYIPGISTKCNSPVFDEEAYAFEVTEDASVGDVVGRVSATSRDGLTVTYFISGGNWGSFFSIDEESGEIKVAEELVGIFEYTVTLRVQAEEANRGAAYVEAMVTIIEVEEE